MAFHHFFLNAQPVASWDGFRLSRDNGILGRQLVFHPDTGSFSTIYLNLEDTQTSYLSETSAEFSFTANGQLISGHDSWKVNGFRPAFDALGGEGATIILELVKEPAAGLIVELTYLLYPGLPVIRKQIKLINATSIDLNIENLDVENLEIQGNFDVPWQRDIDSLLLTDYCRRRTIGPYKVGLQDSVIVVHDIQRSRGIALGNESPGVLKRTGVFLDGKSATIGLTYNNEDYPFRKWLSPGEQWCSPWTFIALYKDTDDPFQIIDGPVNDFVRRHMGIRLTALDEKPAFVYNTWKPFKGRISEKMILEVAHAAAACGVKEFVIDAGWATNQLGKYEIDTMKFPNGLKPLFDSIRAMGMKPGLWFSIAYAGIHTDIYQDNPHWFLQDPKGNHYNLHTDNQSGNSRTACLATGWFDHIKSKILIAVREYELEYAKLDFSTVASAYRTDKLASGCHANDHPLHRDRPESHLVLYRRLWQLFDELHQEAPNLFIDCTFETMGGIQLIDYDMCKHAEGNWLSNFKQTGPIGALRVRHMAWWRSPVIPATALVIGNMEINDPDSELILKSLAGALPILLGDPRELTVEKRESLNQLAEWMTSMQNKYDYMMFRQDLPGFGEPAEGFWDGFQRMNTEMGSGGIVGVFRHGSKEKQRQVFINYLNPERKYALIYGPNEERIGIWSGQELKEQGFSLNIEKEYDGILLEVRGL